MKNKRMIIFSIIVFLLLGVLYYNQNISREKAFNSDNNLRLLKTETAVENLSPDSKATKDELEIIVHLAGAVKNAGVYKLNKKDRLVDLIKAAGGLKENADLKQINLAEKLFDGQKLIIPELAEQIDQNSTAADQLFEKGGENLLNKNFSSSSSNLVNINQADQTELEKLSGIGPAKAAAIIKYREENSYFSQKEDLLKISGIGDKTLENIKDEIVL